MAIPPIPPATARAIAFVAALSVVSPASAASPANTSDLSSVSGENWPSFRGLRASGLVEDAKLPTSWDVEAGANLRWKTAIPGLGHSSPVVWGNRIYLTTAVAEEGRSDLRVGLYGDIAPVRGEGTVRWLLLALDRASGEVRWEREVHRGIPTVKRHPKATHANSTPAVDGRHVVVMLGSEGLHTYGIDGSSLWRKDLGTLDSGFYLVPSAQWGFASSPIIHAGHVIVQADVQGDSFLAAFDVETGDEIWRTQRDEVPTWSTPTVAPRGPGLQIVVNGWKHIGGYDFASGRELWQMAGGGDIPVPTPIVAADLVLITSAHGPESPIYAVRLDAEGEIEDSRHIAWQHGRSGNYMQTPIVVGDIAYFCRDNGVLTSYELATGREIYKRRLGTGRRGFSSSPVANRSKLFFTSEDGETYVVATGREFHQLAVNELGETFLSTPAITGHWLLFRARHHLFAIGE